MWKYNFYHLYIRISKIDISYWHYWMHVEDHIAPPIILVWSLGHTFLYQLIFSFGIIKCIPNSFWNIVLSYKSNKKIIFITYILGFWKLIFLFGIIKCRNYTLGVFCARGKAEGYKTPCGSKFYLILWQRTHFECLKQS